MNEEKKVLGQLYAYGGFLRSLSGINTLMKTAHINERLVTEAQLLLSHTDWGVGEIAYSLGFEYPTYFNNFFRKHTGTTPLAFRRAPLPAATA